MWDECGWPPPALSRFPGGAPPCPPPIDCGAAVSGYAVSISGFSVPSPLLAAQDPSVGQFTRDVAVPAVLIGAGLRPQYVRTDTPSGIVGGGLFGLGAIGYRRAYHGALYPQAVAGYTVYLDAQGNPA